MPVTIEKVQPGTGKVSTVIVAAPGKNEGDPPVKTTLKHWTETPFKDKLVAGAVVSIKTQEKDGYNGGPKERWLIEVDGIGEKAAKTGGGGGYKAPPKTILEIHSSCVAGIIKSYLESMGTKEKTVEGCQSFVTLYFDNVKGLPS